MTQKEIKYITAYIDRRLAEYFSAISTTEDAQIRLKRFAERVMSDISGQQMLPQMIFRQFLQELSLTLNDVYAIAGERNTEIEDIKQRTAAINADSTTIYLGDEQRKQVTINGKLYVVDAIELNGVINAADNINTSGDLFAEKAVNTKGNVNADKEVHAQNVFSSDGNLNDAIKDLKTIQSTADTAKGTANEANERSKTNQTRLDTVQGTATAAQALAESNQKLLGTVEGTANAAKALADSNTTLLGKVEGTANEAKALAESANSQISTIQGTAANAKTIAEQCKEQVDTLADTVSGFSNGEPAAVLHKWSNVQLVAYDKNLYVIADGDYIKETDEVVLFRYVKTTSRIRKNNKHQSKIGWKEPAYKTSKVALQIWDVTGTHTNNKKIFCIGQRTLSNNTLGNRPLYNYTYPIAIFSNMEQTASASNDENFYLFNKKCGIRIRRNGEWLTDYLPFMARKVMQSGGYSYGIGRWGK